MYRELGKAKLNIVLPEWGLNFKDGPAVLIWQGQILADFPTESAGQQTQKELLGIPDKDC